MRTLLGPAHRLRKNYCIRQDLRGLRPPWRPGADSGSSRRAARPGRGKNKKSPQGLDALLEKAEESCLGSWFRITVGSVQTLMRQSRLERFSQDYFSTIIIDEAHHCAFWKLSANSPVFFRSKGFRRYRNTGPRGYEKPGNAFLNPWPMNTACLKQYVRDIFLRSRP